MTEPAPERGLWRLLLRWLRAPESPPALPDGSPEAVEVFLPASGYLRYLRWEALVTGLLIAAALDDVCLRRMLAAAREQGVDALVEVHTRQELERALTMGAELLGINNRDLRDFHTDVAVTRELLPYTGDCTVISESGLDDPAVLRALEAEGVHAFLVGEALMREGDPGEALRKLREVE